MELRDLSLLDRVIGEINKAINVLTAPASAGRPSPVPAPEVEDAPSPVERAGSARLMRVNHSGEVAAQALYRGQAFTARTAATAAAMQQAAAEEGDHLAWCEQRLHELGGRTSLLNPLWYGGSFTLGALAGMLGDRASLGFVAETERQVEAHLRGHLHELAGTDRKSRAILEQMTRDEIRHGAHAKTLGAAELPRPVSGGMRLLAKLMTRGSYWL